MKIRQGFVSNSSSSSFILRTDNEFKTVRDVALYMLNREIEDIIDDDVPDDNDSYLNSKKECIKRINDVDVDSPVTFHSINYDTYIIKFGDDIFISTCNNTIWDLPNIVNKPTENTIEILKKTIGEKKTKELLTCRYDFFLSSYFKKFYSLNYSIFGIEADYDDFKNWDDRKCNKCKSYLWKTRLGIKCPICDVHLLKRKDKLQQIEKKSKEM